MTTRTFTRAPAFESLTDMLDWSERHGAKPVVERGPDGTLRGSVETEAEDAQEDGGPGK